MLALRNLRYYWVANIPVFLGVMLGAAVLTGALFVGDSLRGSLKARAERQLNGVGSAYIGTRMIREETAQKIPEATPALILTGSAVARSNRDDEKRLGRVTILGLKDADRAAFDLPDGVVISATVADRLGVQAVDTIELVLQRMSKIPRSSLMGQRDVADLTKSTRFIVAAVLPREHPMNDFNLTPNPMPPLNVFVPLAELQKPLDIVGKVNALLSKRGDTEASNSQFRDALDLEDWGLRTAVAPARQAYVSLESEQLILDGFTVAAVEKAATAIGARSERTLTYMANAIYPGAHRLPNKESGSSKSMIAYSVIAALDPAAPAPLGPFAATEPLGEGIYLLDWPGSPLAGLKVGDPITIAYFKPEMEAEAIEVWHTLPFRGYIPFAGPALDANLAPPFPGITDKPRIRGPKGEQWEAPFDINYQRIGPRDDEFWDKHRATPKAYISTATGQALFGSRFGSTTSIRVAPIPGTTPEETAARMRSELAKHLDADAAGLKFEPTRERMLRASKGGTDFGAMLLAFSALLILAAMLLVAMLVRLAVSRRAKEIGLLLATGYTPRQVARILHLEGTVVSFCGALAGLVLAWAYARGMLAVLAALWPDESVQSYLRVHVAPLSIAIGFTATMVITWLAIWLSLRGLLRRPAVALMRGETNAPETAEMRPNSRRGWIVIWLSLLVGIALVAGGGRAPNADQRAGAFFGGGFFIMLSGLLLFRRWLKRPTAGASPLTLLALGLRNTSRAAGRSLLTAALLALATFLLVAVESFRKKPDDGFRTVNGGSGGYRLIAETDVPIFQRFDREPGRGDLLEQLQKRYGGSSSDPRLATATTVLDAAKVEPFRLRGGDDASCLNLYQAGRPRILGASPEFRAQGRFAFAMTTAKTDATEANPWLLLDEEQTDGAIPVIAEQNTVLWQLKTFVGGTTTIPDESGREVKLRIVGTLQDSIFPRELIVSDARFRKLYPHEEGFRYFLVETPPENAEKVAGLLETGLMANGMQTTRSEDLVAAQQAVIGAYLSTFQLLGGLALLLGMFGFGVVILRSVHERTGEFALLRATGYTTGTLQKLVLIESGLVLIVGVGIGLLAAIISVIPNLALGGQLASVRLGGMLAVIVAVGFAVAYRATSWIARLPLIASLRRE